MPFKDPKKKQRWNREWKAKQMQRGYGRWLYQRRKLRFDDAERFRQALMAISGCTNVHDAHAIASDAIIASQEAEEALGEWGFELADANGG